MSADVYVHKKHSHGLTRIKHGNYFSFDTQRHRETYYDGSFELKVAIVYRPKDKAQLLDELKSTGTALGR